MKEQIDRIDDFLIDGIFQPLADRCQGRTVGLAMALWTADNFLCLAWSAFSWREHPFLALLMFGLAFFSWNGRTVRRSLVRAQVEGAGANLLRVSEGPDRLRVLFFLGLMAVLTREWGDLLIFAAFLALACHRYIAACKDGGARVLQRRSIWARAEG